MCVSGIYSIGTEIKIAESGMSTSAVDIEIKEYAENNKPFNGKGWNVMPGDEIILIPRINNLGTDCYVRVKIEYTINNEVFKEKDYIEGNYSSWTKKGDYYYYKSVLSKKDSIDIFNKVTVPNLSDEYYGKKLIVNITADAVQAKHFDGNWDDVEILSSIDRSYDIDYEGDSSVIYEDSSNRHIKLNEDFFGKLGNLHPGDKKSDNFSILNSSNSKIEYYLSIGYDSLSNEEKELLQKIKLLITKQDGQILVDSNLLDKSVYTLGIYSSGEGDIYTIELSLPKDIDNKYSKLFTKIKWIFSCEEIEKGGDIINPQTWDINFDLSITAFLISTIGFIVVLFLGKKETDSIEKK